MKNIHISNGILLLILAMVICASGCKRTLPDAVVIEAFIGLLGPASRFPENTSPTERLRLQMHITAKAFRGRVGALVTALLAEAQFDPELAKSFKANWTLPRRKLVHDVLKEAITVGEVRADIDIETAIDAFYGPIYYRLQMGTGPISDAYVNHVFQQAIEGQRRTGASRESSSAV